MALRVQSILLADSSHLGRLDFSSMSCQAKMEILVAPLKDVDKFQDESGNFIDVEDWPGLTFEKDDTLVYIAWRTVLSKFFPHGGSIDTQWIPSTVESFDIHNNNLEGTIECAFLPPCLEILDCSKNQMSGSFSVGDLPRGMKRVRIEKNRFSGSLEVDALPPTVEYFIASENKFQGTLNFLNVPERTKEIRLADNAFSGSVDFSKLPSSLQYLDIRRNPIRQESTVITEGFRRRLYCLAWSDGQIQRIFDTQGAEIDMEDAPRPFQFAIFSRVIQHR